MNWYKIANMVSRPFMLDFPQSKQSTDYTCGPAVLESVLNYYGFDIREHRLADELNTSFDHGTEHDEIANLVKELGLKLDIRSMKINDVIAYLKKKVPVILWIQAWAKEQKSNPNFDYRNYYEAGHYLVAIGYDDKGLYCQDPWLTHHGFISYNDLEQKWHGKDNEGRKLSHIGMAIYGVPPRYKSKRVIEIK